jgi:hypothetical protein
MTHRPSPIAALAIPALLVGPVARAQEPVDWPTLLREADLVVRARVVDGGVWQADVEVEEVYAGAPPADRLTVVGFADPIVPPDALAIEALRSGDQVWLFLEPMGPPLPDPLAMPWTSDPRPTPEGRTFAPPTPHIGDVLRFEDGVHVRLLATSDSIFGPPMAPADWESLLRAMLQVHRDGEPVSQALERARACLDRRPSPPLEDPLYEGEAARCLATLHLLGDDRWTDRILDWGATEHPATRAAAAVLASRHLDRPEARTLLVEALLDQDRTVASLAVPLLQLRADAVVDMLLPLLSRPRQPDGPPAPVPVARLAPDPVRIRIIELIGALGDGDAVPALAREVRYANPQVLWSLFHALDTLEPGSWVEAARPLLVRPEPRLLQVVVDVLEVRGGEGLADDLARIAFDPRSSPWITRIALRGLSTVGDAAVAQRVQRDVMAHLDEHPSWDDDTVDELGAEVQLLAERRARAALPVAWRLAGSYLGVPRELADPEARARHDRVVKALASRAEDVLPDGAEVEVRWHPAGPLGAAPGPKDRVLVDGRVPEGLEARHRRAVAEALEVPIEQVRLCGRVSGRVQCLETRGGVWRRHQVLALPVVRILAAAAGRTEEGWERGAPDPEAAAWLEVFAARGGFEDTDTQAVADSMEGFTARRTFHGPAPLVPLPEVDLSRPRLPEP